MNAHYFSNISSVTSLKRLCSSSHNRKAPAITIQGELLGGANPSRSTNCNLSSLSTYPHSNESAICISSRRAIGEFMEVDDLQYPFVLRSLQSSDFHKGYLQLLEQLTEVGEISEEVFAKRVQELQKLGDHYRISVIEDVSRHLVVATATLLIELKILRNCGKVGHIEDVVVDHRVRGKHLGQRVVANLKGAAKELGCYKVILDCSKENAPFYEKCGFFQKELQMACYF